MYSVAMEIKQMESYKNNYLYPNTSHGLCIFLSYIKNILPMDKLFSSCTWGIGGRRRWASNRRFGLCMGVRHGI